MRIDSLTTDSRTKAGAPKTPEASKTTQTSKTVAALIGGPTLEAALTAAEAPEYFHVAPLPYRAKALEPVISREDLKERCEEHHAFVRALNKAAAHEKMALGTSLEALFSRADQLSKNLRLNGGAHWNFSFFWATLTDQKEDQEMPLDLQKAIEQEWRSLEEFKAAFVREAYAGPKEGWVWLIKTPADRLAIVTTPHEDNPLMTREGDEPRGRPLLGCPLRGGANHREEFAKRFFALVNWQRLEKLLVETRESMPSAGKMIVH